jgi:hypothetical protein
MLTHYAIEVTEENTPAITAFCANYLELNVADDLDGVVESYAETGETPYVIAHVSRIDLKRHAKVYVIGSESFARCFQFSGTETCGPLNQIENI